MNGPISQGQKSRLALVRNYNYKLILLSKNDPETGEPLGIENVVEDTPLLINIKGCGYPPEVNCDAYAEKYYNHSMVGGGGMVVWGVS